MVVEALARRTSVRIEALPQGLRIAVGPHVGTVTLSQLRLVIEPKLRLDALMTMIAYAFELTDCALTPSYSRLLPAPTGLTDLLGVALLEALAHIRRQGLVQRYQDRHQALSSPRGRIVMGRSNERHGQRVLNCHFQELTLHHPLHQVLSAGLRLAAQLVKDSGLRQRLCRDATQLSPQPSPSRLDSATLGAAQRSIDRRTRHYRPALGLLALLLQGSSLDPRAPGDLATAGFLLDMNLLFERFLTRYLQQQAPSPITVSSQDTRTDVFAYLENPHGWQRPNIRPDLLFLHEGKPVAIGDAKYRDHYRHPPGTAELYQLVTYGLAYPLPEPRRVFLFYPLTLSAINKVTPRLCFAPSQGSNQIHIELIGVPIDSIVAGTSWWPCALN